MRIVALAVAPLIVGAVLAVVLVRNEQDNARLAVDRDVRAAAAASLSDATAALQMALDTAAAGGPTAKSLTIDQAAQGGADPDALIQVRDSGKAMLDDTANPPSVVVATYRTAVPPATSAERRAAVTGYLVVPLALGPSIADLAPADGGVLIAGPHRIVSAQPGPQPHGARSFAVAIDPTVAPGWRLVMWQRAPGEPGVAWFEVLAVLGVALAASAHLTVRSRREVAAATERARLERDSSLVAGLAPVVQGSLDLADVVPAAVAHLAESLGLEGVSLSRPYEGRERALFSWGSPPDADASPPPVLPEELPRHATFALPLSRGGRVLGVLRVVAGEPLTGGDLRALTTASELLGAALANAESFAQQRDLVQRMRAVDELKTVFLATASHELRTPVVAIVGFSSLLLEQWDDMTGEDGRLYAERIHANARSLDALIEDLLDFSRLERGVLPMADEVFDLGAAVHDTLADHSDVYADHRLVARLPEGYPIRGSRSAIERIVTNLVGNAAKYSPSDSTVTVVVAADGDRVLLHVDDQGQGVPEADRERIFSRFYRGQDDSVARTRGAGMGLAIVSEFAASMGAQVTVSQAAHGTGARFTVSFPLAATTISNPEEGAPHVPVP
ncbi:MAG TPA: HAMP domain-containing sensor histidine kinase [Mycobacteriales bacterium]|nr:HAMP domain-containing sensor histidine kinase [Mycobacteriales bacterium]